MPDPDAPRIENLSSMAPSTMSPSQIDTVLSRIYMKAADEGARLERAQERLASERKSMAAGHGVAGGGTAEEYYSGEVERLKANLEVLKQQAAPYNAEYTRRGGWPRYFLVTSSDGHVHRERNCSTTYFSTQFSWLPELSGSDEKRMVDEYGVKACTVCFPSAPTYPSYKRSAEEQARLEAEKASSICSESGQYAEREAKIKPWAKYAKCPKCGEVASITMGGKFREHKKISERDSAMRQLKKDYEAKDKELQAPMFQFEPGTSDRQQAVRDYYVKLAELDRWKLQQTKEINKRFPKVKKPASSSASSAPYRPPAVKKLTRS